MSALLVTPKIHVEENLEGFQDGAILQANREGLARETVRGNVHRSECVCLPVVTLVASEGGIGTPILASATRSESRVH